MTLVYKSADPESGYINTARFVQDGVHFLYRNKAPWGDPHVTRIVIPKVAAKRRGTPEEIWRKASKRDASKAIQIIASIS